DRACPGHEPLAVAAIINLFGMTDLDAFDHDATAGGRPWVQHWLARDPTISPVLAYPIHYVRSQLPPILTIHGDADRLVPFAQAAAMDEALRRAGAEHTLVRIAGGEHGTYWFRRGAGADQEAVAIKEFLVRHRLMPSSQVDVAQRVERGPQLAIQRQSVGKGECVVVAPLKGGAETAFGGDEECDRRTLPASTFKIPHALIALQTGVVTETTVMKWDGAPKDFKSWERDHTLASAIQSSVLWFFQRAAVAIGRERELQHLRAFRYGSQTFPGEVDRFWLNGDLAISPREQVTFLKRMFSHDLPIEARHINTVKTAMTMPPWKLSNAAGLHDFPLAWPAGTAARMKTGNGTVNGERVSWVIGQLETDGRQYVFASRVTSKTRTLESTAGADLALRILNTMVP
ncbi:MAG: prolyl oligopeptidase family serine peptidase, partial [Acidobacteria bacterium]|nr:prolyl oligopeptidase family serine peptidase [Acidobacteriota bacterium]